MNQIEAMEIANSKHSHQHSRWNTWTLFFFGLIISVFTMWSTVKSMIPIYVPFMISSFVSFLWIPVAVGIRRSHHCWFTVMKKIGKGTKGKYDPIRMYIREEDNFPIMQDLLKIRFTSVTKVLIYFGLASCVLFTYGTIYFYCYKSNSIDKNVNIEVQKELENSCEGIKFEVY